MATGPLLSVICPTIGRPSLARTLASIRDQADAADVELLVVADTYQQRFAYDLRDVPALCAAYEARYLEYDGGCHAWGHPQRQAGMAAAQGAWLAWTQDDSAWLPETWATLKWVLMGADNTYPWLFRVVPRCRKVVWDEQGLIAEGHVDADGIVAPNKPARLGTWGMTYAGDAAFIAETVARWDGVVGWHEALIAAVQTGV